MSNTQPVRLTERERTVLEMLAAGWGIDLIGRSLELDDSGDCHSAARAWESVSKKLGAKTMPHAIALAIRGGHIL